MFDFLGFEDAGSPLYGRHFVQIQMGNFSASEAEDFLVKGFQQIDLATPSEVIQFAVQNLDGVAGWLTLFGTRCRDKRSCSKEMVDEVVSEAGRLAREETLKLTMVSRRYGVILNFLASAGSASWGQIKGAIEAKERHSVTNAAVSNLLSTLKKAGLVEKADGKYTIVDVLLAKGVKEEALPD
jgi:AAA+ ATPase superfamily predicted ATPase